ncbi:MAG TPA: hypothetical protein VM370_11155 [Candidatus Thermoplasmatota archaeon]|nr:hypothetical protein [Candidatus Thermoplasmatota archaeon]
MRVALAAILVAAALWTGAHAFSAADPGARDVTATVVGDASSYLSVAVNAASPHAAFATQDATTGLISMSFAQPAGVTGTGVNPGAGYYFHDLLKITNQGNATAYVQATAAATTGSVAACLASATGAMTRTCYGAASPANALSLTVGSVAYVGVHVNATGLSSGSVAGSLHIVACRSAAGTCANG